MYNNKGSSKKEGDYLKNVIINKIVQYVFTEDQLRGKWLEKKKEPPFEKLNAQHLTDLAKEILAASSPSELEEYSLNSAWRTPADAKGKVICEDDTDSKMHIELIDTDGKNSNPRNVVIDRLHQLACLDCHFRFSIENFDYDLTNLKCPVCGSNTIYNINRN